VFAKFGAVLLQIKLLRNSVLPENRISMSHFIYGQKQMRTRGFHNYRPTPVSHTATNVILDNLDYTCIRTLDPRVLATSY